MDLNESENKEVEKLVGHFSPSCKGSVLRIRDIVGHGRFRDGGIAEKTPG
jgi:hypothetical protein